MKGKIICIVIALMVLSIGAIIGAERIFITHGQFSSTLNGVPVRVSVTQVGSASIIEPMRARDLRNNWAEHEGRLVRFTGVVENNSSPIFIGPDSDRILTLEGAPTIEVYPLKASDLPAIYHEGDEYEFTGFLIRHEAHAEHQKSGNAKMRVYAFQIRHLREAQ